MADHSSSRAGRPTDERKTEAILDAARTLMLTGEFDTASMDRIANEAGVSKVTLYSRFGDKTGLTEAMIRRQATMMTEMIGAANREASSLRERLHNFGVTLFSFLLSDQYYHIDTMLGGLRREHPEATRRFFEAGPATMRSELIGTLEDAAATGEIGAEDIGKAAEQLLSLWRGFREIERRFGVRDTIPADELHAHVDDGIDVFLTVYGAR